MVLDNPASYFHWLTNEDSIRALLLKAVRDPEASLVCYAIFLRLNPNFQINWGEMGSDQRLLDLTSENEWLLRGLCAGLGVTEGMLTGDASREARAYDIDFGV